MESKAEAWREMEVLDLDSGPGGSVFLQLEGKPLPEGANLIGHCQFQVGPVRWGWGSPFGGFYVLVNMSSTRMGGRPTVIFEL